MTLERSSRPLARCLQWTRHDRSASISRCFSVSALTRLEAEVQPQTTSPPVLPARLNPNHVTKLSQEQALFKATGQRPIGSRRRRAVLKQMHGDSIPFEQLPYHCFQEARNVLREDRNEKLKQIQLQRERIERLRAREVAPQDEGRKEHRLKSMRTTLEELKIFADINDPLVKKKFEDGIGDMNKPIYRHLADRKWREYKRKVLVQRITQMNVVPDVLPECDPVVSTQLTFRGRKIQHGDLVASILSERPPQMEIQPYDRGERLVTIAVINPDAPNVADDGFDYRCHFLASNILISPTQTKVNFANLSAETQVIQPWLPAYSQKGLPYQRMSVFILEQPQKETTPATDGNATRSQLIDVKAVKEAGRDTAREKFMLRSFQTRHRLKAVGADLFRAIHDANTAGVMQRAGIAGSDVEFKRKRIEPLPYKRLSTNRYR